MTEPLAQRLLLPRSPEPWTCFPVAGSAEQTGR